MVTLLTETPKNTKKYQKMPKKHQIGTKSGNT